MNDIEYSKARKAFDLNQRMVDFLFSSLVIHILVVIWTALWSFASYGWSMEIVICIGYITLFSIIGSSYNLYKFLDEEDSNVLFDDPNFSFLVAGLATGFCISLAMGVLYLYERLRIDLIPPSPLILSSIIAIISVIMAISAMSASWHFKKNQ